MGVYKERLGMDKDIFDIVMHLPILKFFEPFYQKHKRILLYLFFGGLTFFVCIGIFAILNIYMGMNELVANILSWVGAVFFAFFTNSKWVFVVYTDTKRELVKQTISFFGGRVLTLAVEEIILFIFITNLGYPSIIIKIIAQIIIIVLNYMISKKIVFKNS